MPGPNPFGMNWLVGQLDAHQGPLAETLTHKLLAQARLTPDEVAPYVQVMEESYGRCGVVRREHYELLVLTWAPAQGSVAHDHSGSLCGLKIVQGALSEQLFEQGPDGQVRKVSLNQFGPGEILVDPGVVIHSLGNAADAKEVLITVHIYSPPLPEIRRYAITEEPPLPVFLRPKKEGARVITIIGGGFTGTMTFANLLEQKNLIHNPLHILLIDRQPAFGEGVAYRTNDSRHVLNVAAGRMSAWPDRPDDFLNYVQSVDPGADAEDYVSRKIYGRYIRKNLVEQAQSAPEAWSAEIIRDEATTLAPQEESGWLIRTTSGRAFMSDVVVVTMGHRLPDDPLAQNWSGPRHRFISDPWAALVLSQIGPDEPVLLLGSGLTAIDTLLTLHRKPRTAPITVVSRRGLLPQPHLPESVPAVDLSELVARWLNSGHWLKAYHLVHDLRRKIRESARLGKDWRSVIDGLRPLTPQIWERLNHQERVKFLHRLRPFWEIHRHRMAPEVAGTVSTWKESGKLEVVAGVLLSAVAHEDSVDVTFAVGSNGSKRTARVSWMVNCTGPGVHNRNKTHPLLRPLLDSGILKEDKLHLGIETDKSGHAVNVRNQPHPTLFFAGTLRKSTLWESTAVPELRVQAHEVARSALNTLKNLPC